jgi:hypothetical protein
MGFWRGKAQNILLGFLSADGTEESTYQGKRYVQKKKGIRKYLSRSTVHLVFDSRACVIRREEQLKGQIMSKNIAR